MKHEQEYVTALLRFGNMFKLACFINGYLSGGLFATSSSILPVVSGYHTGGVTWRKHLFASPFITLIWRSWVQTPMLPTDFPILLFYPVLTSLIRVIPSSSLLCGYLKIQQPLFAITLSALPSLYFDLSVCWVGNS